MLFHFLSQFDSIFILYFNLFLLECVNLNKRYIILRTVFNELRSRRLYNCPFSALVIFGCHCE